MLLSSVHVTLTLKLEAALTVNRNIVAGVESDDGLTILHTRFRALCEADFLFSNHMAIDQHRKQ